MANITELTDESFKKFVEQGVAVVDLWAPWCGPCKMIAPIVEDLAEEYEGKIKFAKLNVDEHKKTQAEYNVMGIPTLLVFKNGRPVDRIVGALSRERIKEKLGKHL